MNALVNSPAANSMNEAIKNVANMTKTGGKRKARKATKKARKASTRKARKTQSRRRR